MKASPENIRKRFPIHYKTHIDFCCFLVVLILCLPCAAQFPPTHRSDVSEGLTTTYSLNSLQNSYYLTNKLLVNIRTDFQLIAFHEFIPKNTFGKFYLPFYVSEIL